MTSHSHVYPLRRRSRTIPLALAALTLGTVGLGAGASAVQPPPPSTYVVSTTADTLPEGIHVTDDGTMYVTSKGTGAVYRGRVDDPTLDLWLPAGEDGRVTATGVHTDPWGRVLVAGAESGLFFVYAPDGRLLSKQQVAGDVFLNDFVVTGGHLYVTDSANGAILRAPISADGVGTLTPWMTASDFAVAPDFLNGIVASQDGATLLVADWLVGRTHRVDVASATAVPLDVRGGDLGGDGLVVRGRTLWSVDNDTDAAGSSVYFVREVRLSPDWRHASVVDDSTTAGADQSPTTIARHGDRLLWVESQFDIWPGTPPYLVREVTGLG